MVFWKRKPPAPPPASTLRTVDAAFVAELERLGFFRFAADADTAKREILTSGYPLAGEVGRQFMADAEELAEGGIRNFLGFVAPFLRSEGVRVEAEYGPWKTAPQTQPDPNPYPGPTLRMKVSLERGGELVDVDEAHGDPYRVTLGGRTIAFENGWAEAATQTVALLNMLLSKHGSAERAWLLYGGGNDGFVVFATQEQAALVNAAVPEREKLSVQAS
jgi:hypothetical protein